MTSSAREILRVERDGPVALVTRDRPEEKNARSIALRDAVSDAFDEHL